MEHSILWVAFALGGIAWLISLMQTRASKNESGSMERPLASVWFGVAMGVAALVFAATLPTKAPFAEGQGFGRGFVLGGLLSLLAVWTVASARNGKSLENASRPAAELAAPFGLAVVSAASVLLFLNVTRIDSLLGVAIGWLSIAMVCLFGLFANGRNQPSETLSEKRQSMAGVVMAGVGFAVTVCVTTALGRYRGNLAPVSGTGMMAWSSPALLLASLVPLLLLINALPAWVYARIAVKLPLWSLLARLFARLFPNDAEKDAAGNSLRLILSAAALLLLTKLITVKVVAQGAIFQVIALGLLAALVAWWLQSNRESEAEYDNPLASLVREKANALGVLVILAGSIVAFQLLAGLGIALYTCAGWLIGGIALASALEPKENAALSAPVAEEGVGVRGLLTALLFATVLCLYRLYTTRYEEEMRGMILTDQYALFSFVIGALVPTALAGFALPRLNLSAGTAFFRIVVAGILTLLVPGLMLLLWGAKCSLALLIGLALAVAGCSGIQVFRYSGIQEGQAANAQHPTFERLNTRTPEHLNTLLPALFALAIGLALTQWTNHVLPMAEMTRDAKIGLLKWLAGGAILLILVADYGSRFGKRREEISGAAARGAAK